MVVQTFTVQIGSRKFASLERGLIDIERRLSKAMDKSAPKVSQELLKALNLVTRRMIQKHGTPWRAGGSGRNLFRRSGSGLRGIRELTKVSRGIKLEQVRGQIGAKFPLSVHERGATIRPTRAQYLTIPLPAALDSSGIPRRRRARDWDNTFVARSRRGNLLIFQKRGEEIVPLYLLRREVRLPARLSLGSTLDTEGLPFFERRAFEAISKELDRTA